MCVNLNYISELKTGAFLWTSPKALPPPSSNFKSFEPNLAYENKLDKGKATTVRPPGVPHRIGMLITSGAEHRIAPVANRGSFPNPGAGQGWAPWQPRPGVPVSMSMEQASPNLRFTPLIAHCCMLSKQRQREPRASLRDLIGPTRSSTIVVAHKLYSLARRGKGEERGQGATLRGRVICFGWQMRSRTRKFYCSVFKWLMSEFTSFLVATVLWVRDVVGGSSKLGLVTSFKRIEIKRFPERVGGQTRINYSPLVKIMQIFFFANLLDPLLDKWWSNLNPTF